MWLGKKLGSQDRYWSTPTCSYPISYHGQALDNHWDGRIWCVRKGEIVLPVAERQGLRGSEHSRHFFPYFFHRNNLQTLPHRQLTKQLSKMLSVVPNILRVLLFCWPGMSLDCTLKVLLFLQQVGLHTDQFLIEQAHGQVLTCISICC